LAAEAPCVPFDAGWVIPPCATAPAARRLFGVGGQGKRGDRQDERTLGYKTGSGKTELEGDAQRLKGETQQAVGKARRRAKKATR
jgi:hypothetical protein